MSELIVNIGLFNQHCLLPFISGFFTSTVGFCFVGTVCIVVVLRGLATLFKTKF